MDELDLNKPIVMVEPTRYAQMEVNSASDAYEKRSRQITGDNLEDLTLKSCIILAVQHNRSLRRTTHRTRRNDLQRQITQSDLDAARLNASYTLPDDGSGTGDGRVSATGRVAGFEIEPFVDFLYDEFGKDDDFRTTTYGVAVSRNVFRLANEYLRQVLPLTRATRDFHLAINDRILELRRLHLSVVQQFLDIQRLKMRVNVRQNRVKDAQVFLRHVMTKFEADMVPRVDITNARINLNQAETDLISEQTNLQNASDSLLDLLGADLNQSLTIHDDALSDDQQLQIDLESDIELVKTYHERVRNQQLNMEVQRQIFRISKDELIPDLLATFSTDKDVETGIDSMALRLDLSVPLDGYRAERARAAQDRLLLMEMVIDLAAIRSNLLRQLRMRYRTIRQLKVTVQLAKHLLESERRKLEATLLRYDRGGDVDNLEVTRAKETVDRAELALLEARIARIVEEARYRALLPAAVDQPAPKQGLID